VYLLYWYKSTYFTSAKSISRYGATGAVRYSVYVLYWYERIWFTGFTGAVRYSVYVLYWYERIWFTGFTGTKLSRIARQGAHRRCPTCGRSFTQFTCFTGTKVQILTRSYIYRSLRALPISSGSRLRPRCQGVRGCGREGGWELWVWACGRSLSWVRPFP
jgi:hypothetical protein